MDCSAKVALMIAIKEAMVTSQVAAVSGDVRRCLELLRRAAEITEAKSKQAALPDGQAAGISQAAQGSGIANTHATA